MGTSSLYNYNPTAATIITDALRLLGVIEESGTASSAQLTDSTPAFEMYLKGLSKYGLNIWTINSAGESKALTASQVTYTTTNPALKILECTFRDSDLNDKTLRALSREEYWAITDKDETGEPNQYFFDPSNATFDNGTIYLWPAPDSTAETGTLHIVYQTYIEDMNNTTNEIAVPQEWLETIKYGLATRLAPMYGYPVQERNLLLQEYNLMLKDSLDWDTEQESIFLQPEPRG